MVLGLDRGGTCEGIAFRVAPEAADEALRYLRSREQINGVYREAHLPVELLGSRREVLALTYIVERAHPAYAGRLPLSLQAQLIRGARGASGGNLDYLINTLQHLAELGIRERDLERLLAVIAPHAARGPAAQHVHAFATGITRTVRPKPIGFRMRRLKPAQRRRFLYRQRLALN
jgi:cation transport protein ChaC